jgi:hypothetical protein
VGVVAPAPTIFNVGWNALWHSTPAPRKEQVSTTKTQRHQGIHKEGLKEGSCFFVHSFVPFVPSWLNLLSFGRRRNAQRWTKNAEFRFDFVSNFRFYTMF